MMVRPGDKPVPKLTVWWPSCLRVTGRRMEAVTKAKLGFWRFFRFRRRCDGYRRGEGRRRMPGFAPGRHEACGALVWRFQRGGRAAAGPRGLHGRSSRFSRPIQWGCHSAGGVGRGDASTPIIGREGLLRLAELARRLQAGDLAEGDVPWTVKAGSAPDPGQPGGAGDAVEGAAGAEPPGRGADAGRPDRPAGGE